MLVTHAKELLQQIEGTLLKIGVTDVGVYSAGLSRQNTSESIILGGIQSCYFRADQFGQRDVIFIDEAHRINPRSDDTMYGKFFDGFPNARLIGLTATPYRLGTGWICDEDSWLNEISYEVSVGELVGNGYLSKLTSKCMFGIDTSRVKIVRGEFVEEEQQKLFLEASEEINDDVLARTQDRNSVLIFCSGVEAAKKTRQFFMDRKIACGLVTGDTPDDIRAEYIEAFRNGEIKYLANCNVFTEGFDAPNVDCVVLERATVSAGLFYQMAGRGLRKHPAKENCLILDYGENLLRHGPIDRISPRVTHKTGGEPPIKACPKCREAMPAAARVCTECGFEFEFEDKTEKLDRKPSKAAALSEDVEAHWYPIKNMTVRSHTKKNAEEGSKKTICASYFDGLPFGNPLARQFICVEHTGMPRTKAEKWWRQFHPTLPPKSADEAAEKLTELLKGGDVQPPTAIKCVPSSYDSRYLDIVELSWDVSFLDTEEIVDDVF